MAKTLKRSSKRLSIIVARKQQRKPVQQLSFAEYRAQIKLPYKPAHITEEQIQKALHEVAA